MQIYQYHREIVSHTTTTYALYSSVMNYASVIQHLALLNSIYEFYKIAPGWESDRGINQNCKLGGDYRWKFTPAKWQLLANKGFPFFKRGRKALQFTLVGITWNSVTGISGDIKERFFSRGFPLFSLIIKNSYGILSSSSLRGSISVCQTLIWSEFSNNR